MAQESIHKTFGNAIRRIRESLGLSQDEFGQFLTPPVNQNQVSRWERGIGLTLKSIERILNALPKGTQIPNLLDLPSSTDKGDGDTGALFSMVGYLDRNLSAKEKDQLQQILSTPRGRNLFLQIAQALVAENQHFRSSLRGLLALTVLETQTEDKDP